MTTRVLRNTAPRFELNLPPRQLHPMAAVSRDALGTTTYAAVSQTQSCYGAQPQSHGATKVLPHLYLGSMGDARSRSQLRTLGIRRVLNVAGECECPGGLEDLGITTKHLNIRDHSDECISNHFEECLQFIRDGIEKDEAVLVHCRFGVSRSATIVIAYLMEYGTQEHSPMPQRMSYEDSFDFVKERRPQVSPNLGFVLALHQLERGCQNS